MTRLTSSVLRALILVLFVFPFSAAAQTPPAPAWQAESWVSTGGPVGGLGYDVRMSPDNPDVMYVTDAWAGIFKSLDGGQSWFPSSQGIITRGGASGDAVPVFCLTVDPNNPQRLWAGTQFYSGVYRSDDAGKSWQPMNKGIQERAPTIRGFTVEPGNSNVVYLMGEVSSWEWNNQQEITGVGTDTVKGIIYKSEDGGETWRRIWYGDNLARYLWINPQDHNLLYVSTGIFDREAANSNVKAKEPGGVGVLRSRDGGETWEELNEANGFDPYELTIGSLYMKPDDPATLLAASGSDPYAFLLGRTVGGIYLTQDGGNSWQKVLGGHVFSAVEYCAGNPQIAYAGASSGVFRSKDGGQTWTQTVSGWWGPPGIVAGFPIDMQCDPRNANRIFVNNYGGGNFLSEDGGQTWRNASKGYTGALMAEVETAPHNPNLVYATARSGVFKSEDGGQTWQGLAHHPARAMEALALAVDPQNGQRLLASVGDAGPNPKISHDSGQTWTNGANNLWNSDSIRPGDITTRIRFAPSDPRLIFASVGDLGCTFLDDCSPDKKGSGVIASFDGGQTWQQTELTTGHFSDLAVAPSNSRRVYAAQIPRRLYRSDDGGKSWQLTSPDAGDGVLPPPPPIVDPDLPPPALTALAVDPQDENRVYAGLRRAGMIISEDGGQTWRAVAGGMPAEASITTFAIDPNTPGAIYAGAAESGVYLSLDAGKTWRPLNRGLTTRAVRDLSLSADGSTLYLATEGSGVFKLGGATAAAPQNNPSPPAEKTPALAPAPTAAPSGKLPFCPAVAALPLLVFGLVVGKTMKNAK